MRNKQLLSIIIFCIQLIICMEIYGQKKDSNKYTWIATYDLKYRLDSTNNQYREESFVLSFNENQSAFQANNIILRDSAMRTDKQNNSRKDINTSSILKYRSNFPEFLITDINKKTVAVSNDFLLDEPIHLEYLEFIFHSWKINKEYKTINGIKCTKAEEDLFGRHWIVWFSTEYPMPFGPYKFFGLPGLIFKIEDSKEDYLYELRSIRKHSTIMPTQYYSNPTRVTKEKYLELFNRYHYTTAMFNSAINSMTPEMQAKAEEMLKKKKLKENNPIELKP
ncbi:MAG: GLPGLI family protein [Arachidicoccus sp.]|nr:GLPGLI family protein [Arachidicoccus sp.]